MLNVSSHQRNANQNENAISPPPVGTGVINKQVLARTWRKGSARALLVRLQTGAATVGNSMEFPHNINIFEEPQALVIRKNISMPMFTAALFTIAKLRKQPRCPSTDTWTEKLWCAYTMECYVTIKKTPKSYHF